MQDPACKLIRCPAYCYDDPGMRSIRFKIFYGKCFEVHSVMRQHGHALTDGIGQLLRVLASKPAFISGCGDLKTVPTNQLGYQNVHIFVEISFDEKVFLLIS